MLVSPTLLAWLVIGLSSLALLNAVQRALGARVAFPTLIGPEGAAVAVTLVAGTLLTVPSQAPFSPGGQLVPGLLGGGAAVLLAVLLAPSRAADPVNRFAAAGAQVAAPTLVTGLLLFFYPGNPLWALGGLGIGAVLAATLFCGRPQGEGSEVGSPEGAEGGAFAALALAGSTYLAVFHHGPLGQRDWQFLPALLGSAVAVGLVLRSRFPTGSSALGAVLLALPILLAAVVGSLQVARVPLLLPALAGGYVAFALVAWLGAVESESGSVSVWRPTSGLLVSLVLLGVGAAAFRYLHGFGLGVISLAGVALLVTAAALDGPESSSRRALLRDAVAFSLLLMLYRVFEQASGYRRAIQADFYYSHAALLLGALLPVWIAGTAAVWGRAGSARSLGLFRTGLAGAAAAAAPLCLWLLVGERPQATFLVGVTVGAALLLAVQRSPEERALGRLLGLTCLLTAIQFTPLLQPLGVRSRWERVGILAVLGVLFLAGVLLTGWRERRDQNPGPLSQASA